MVLSEAEGLLRIAMADLETAEASTRPAHRLAVQFRYDADAAPMGLNREGLNLQVMELIARVEALVVPGSEAKA